VGGGGRLSATDYSLAAPRWTDEAYVDPGYYMRRRAAAFLELGPRLAPGERVLDLACGDGGFAEPLLAAGLRYTGVDGNERMVTAAQRRLAGRARVVLGPGSRLVLAGLERVPPVARLMLRHRFSYVCAAYRRSSGTQKDGARADVV
jgi:SAM-dependent methyltransferase